MAGSIEFFNLLLRARLDTAVPVKGGVMEDYDFLIAGSNEVSRYSKHEAYLDRDFTGTLVQLCDSSWGMDNLIGLFV